MKATIDIPDDLYRRVKAKSALQGRPVRAVAIELFHRWLAEGAYAAQRPDDDHVADRTDVSTKTRRQLAQEWLDEWLRMGAEASKNAPPGPSAREILEEGRNRLERR
jgi:hypothetical protein